MSEEIVNDDATGGGEHDESKEGFLSKWDAMTDSERVARAVQMHQESRAPRYIQSTLSDRPTYPHHLQPLNSCHATILPFGGLSTAVELAHVGTRPL